MSNKDNDYTSKRIFDLIDSIKKKIDRRSNQINRIDLNISQTNNNRYGLHNQMPSDNMRLNNRANDNNDIRAIIRQELRNLTSSFDKKLNDLEYKLNKVSNDCLGIKNEQNNLNNKYNNYLLSNENNLEIENCLSELKKLMEGFVSTDKYEKNNKIIIEQINSNKSSLSILTNNINDISNKIKSDINPNINLEQKIQELNTNYENIKNKFEIFSKNYNNEINNIKLTNNKISTTEIKLNDINNKNISFQKKLDEYSQELNKIKNNINIKNEKKGQIDNENINNINQEIFQIKEKIKKLDKLNIEELSKFNLNKEFQELKTNNIKMLESLEKHNKAINDINTKIEKLNINYENETKRRYGEINTRINKLEEDINKLKINRIDSEPNAIISVESGSNTLVINNNNNNNNRGIIMNNSNNNINLISNDNINSSNNFNQNNSNIINISRNNNINLNNISQNNDFNIINNNIIIMRILKKEVKKIMKKIIIMKMVQDLIFQFLLTMKMMIIKIEIMNLKNMML